jgi:phosphate-selective porin OprO/OprP
VTPRAAALAALLALAIGGARAEDAATDTPAPEWVFDWRGWEGLQMRLVQPTPLQDNLRFVRLDQVRLAGVLSAKVEVDGAAFRTNGKLSGFDDGVELRRARLKLAGDAILGVAFKYKVDLGYVPNEFTLNDFYLALPDLGAAGSLQIGKYQPAMGLQLLTSSWNIALMEPAAPLQAIAPASSPGLQIGRPFSDERATWTFGAYASGGGDSEYGSAGKNLGSLVGRLTWLARDDGPERLLHLGLSANLQLSDNGQIRMRSRPESYIAPYVIDTGTLDADKAAAFAAEIAWLDGAFSAQGELIHSAVSQRDAGPLDFGGFYAQAAWVLTGESRPYDRRTGTFGRLQPLRDFAFGPEGGWGALEAALRYSYTDLDSGSVNGGRLSLLMAGLSWFLRPQLTWRLNVGAGSVRGTAADGRMLIVETRLGVDF